jgi:nucleotide-binding universal stress UspA family protein
MRTRRQGAEIARAVGFDAEPRGRRALSKTAERNTSTVWRAILAIADEQEAPVIVAGARGASDLGSALLGSVSHGLLHNSTRPVLVVPPAR